MLFTLRSPHSGKAMLMAVLLAAATEALAQSRAPSSAPATAQPQEIFAPFFLTTGNFKSTLALQNLRVDVAVTALPSVLVEGQEVVLEPVRLAPKETARMDIGQALAARGLTTTTGAVAVRYLFRTTGALAATVEAEDEVHGINLSVVANGREEYMGTRLDAVAWAPSPINDGFVGVANVTSEPRRVHVTYMLPDRVKTFDHIDIAPRSVHMIKLNPILGRSHASGVGICLAYAGAPGDVYAEGAIVDNRTGFSKRIHFVDSTLHFNDGSVRSNFLLLGSQPAGTAFPTWVSFRSVAAVRNLSPSQNARITPIIRYQADRTDGTPTVIQLKPLLLGPQQSMIVDFAEAQKKGAIPRAVSQAFVEFKADVASGPHTSAAQEAQIVAELINYDERTLGYVVGPSFTAHPSRAVTTDWRTDGTFDTAINIENAGRTDDDVTIRLIGLSGVTFTKELHMPVGALARVSVRALREESRPGVDGRRPLTDDSGALVIEGAHGTKSALVFERLIHDEDSAYYVGPGPCDYITGIDGFISGDSNPFTALIDCYWNTGSETQQSADRYSTTTSSIQLSGNQVTVSYDNLDSGTLSFFLDYTTGCSVCSVMSYQSDLGVKITETWYAFNSQIGSSCFYGPTTACTSGTPSCTGPSFGIGGAPCASYGRARYFVYGGHCAFPGFGTQADVPDRVCT